MLRPNIRIEIAKDHKGVLVEQLSDFGKVYALLILCAQRIWPGEMDRNRSEGEPLWRWDFPAAGT